MYNFDLNKLPLIEYNGRFEPCSRIYVKGIKTKYLITIYGNVYSLKHKQFLKPYLNHKHYLCVDIFYNNKRYHTTIHRIVALTFIKNPYNRPQVNHIDGCKNNNSVFNLEWATNYENMQHAILHDLTRHVRGEDVGTSVYTQEQIEYVCDLLENSNLSLRDISKETNVKYTTVKDINLRRSWDHVTNKYNFNRKKIYDEKRRFNDYRK